MLKALYELAEREGLLEDPSYEPKPVDFFIHLGLEGRFNGVVPAPRDAPRRDAKGLPKGTPKSPPRLIPRRSDRTSDDRADFLVDKAEYVFGIAPDSDRKANAKRTNEEKETKLQVRRGRFRGAVADAASAIPASAALRSVVRFLDADPPHEIRKLLLEPGDWKPEQMAGSLFAFIYDPDGGTHCVHDDPAIREFFRARLQSPEGKTRGQCLVTGEPDAVLTRLHAKPKGIPPVGTTKGGVPLTTVNQESFRSYGLDEFGGAPISEKANFGIESALSRLLDPAYPGADGSPRPRRCFGIAPDSVLVYWTRRDAAIDWFSEVDARDPDEVVELLRSPHHSFTAPLEDPTQFYALILSGKQGRAIVRSFVETTVREVAKNVDRWRAESRIVRPFGKEPGSFALRDVRTALAVRGEEKTLPSAFSAALYLSTVLGRRFAGAILETVVRRNRAGLLPADRRGNPDPAPLAARCSLLKAWFLRNRGREIPVALDKERTEIAYRLGRLLATIDILQANALGQINATIVDRYFGSASSTPAAVFPTLIRRSQSHLGKLRRDKPGLADVRDRLVQEIVSAIDRFPSTLGLEDQGLFAIGFYHQRQDFFTNKEEN
jgi:CRISPR-associated protein Csd1